jgi:hypothetical protein
VRPEGLGKFEKKSPQFDFNISFAAEEKTKFNVRLIFS